MEKEGDHEYISKRLDEFFNSTYPLSKYNDKAIKDIKLINKIKSDLKNMNCELSALLNASRQTCSKCRQKILSEICSNNYRPKTPDHCTHHYKEEKEIPSNNTSNVNKISTSRPLNIKNTNLELRSVTPTPQIRHKKKVKKNQCQDTVKKISSDNVLKDNTLNNRSNLKTISKNTQAKTNSHCTTLSSNLASHNNMQKIYVPKTAKDKINSGAGTSSFAIKDKKNKNKLNVAKNNNFISKSPDIYNNNNKYTSHMRLKTSVSKDKSLDKSSDNIRRKKIASNNVGYLSKSPDVSGFKTPTRSKKSSTKECVTPIPTRKTNNNVVKGKKGKNILTPKENNDIKSINKNCAGLSKKIVEEKKNTHIKAVSNNIKSNNFKSKYIKNIDKEMKPMNPMNISSDIKNKNLNKSRDKIKETKINMQNENTPRFPKKLNKIINSDSISNDKKLNNIDLKESPIELPENTISNSKRDEILIEKNEYTDINNNNSNSEKRGLSIDSNLSDIKFDDTDCMKNKSSSVNSKQSNQDIYLSNSNSNNDININEIDINNMNLSNNEDDVINELINNSKDIDLEDKKKKYREGTLMKTITEKILDENGSKKPQALILAINKGFFPIKKSYNLVISSPLLYQEIKINDLVMMEINRLNNEISRKNNFVAQHNVSLFKKFNFSTQCLNEINSIEKEDELGLVNKFQCSEIISMFTIIYVLLNENYLKIPTKHLIKNLINNIIKKFEVDSLKSFLIKVIPLRINLTSEQMEIIEQIKEEKPIIFCPNEMKNKSKIGGLVSLCLLEIYNFVNGRFSDGVSVVQVKACIKEVLNLKVKSNNLLLMLKQKEQ